MRMFRTIVVGLDDLIVVGSRGRGVTKRHLLGSVSTRVTHHTHRSILVVHGPAGAADAT
jgi:nucleotide-binding universal stress UspA family protein